MYLNLQASNISLIMSFIRYMLVPIENIFGFEIQRKALHLKRIAFKTPSCLLVRLFVAGYFRAKMSSTDASVVGRTPIIWQGQAGRFKKHMAFEQKDLQKAK